MSKTILYDNTTVTPDDSQATTNGAWFDFDKRLASNPFSSGDAEQFVNGTNTGTILNTTGGGANQTDGSNNDNTAGYSNYSLVGFGFSEVRNDFPKLNADNGYTLSFTLQVIDEQNTNEDIDGDGKNDRAGFSVSVVSEDTSEAIEISFEEDQIWAQGIDPNADAASFNSLIQAEVVDFVTTTQVNYDLEVSGQDNKYYLFADGELILDGDLRDYSAVNASGLQPYDNSSQISLSDRTDDARSIVELSEISVTNPSATPTDLFISEYVEGSSNNKAIELYNGTGSAIDLTDYTLEFYSNGNTTPGTSIDLSGTVASGDVFVLADVDADATILAQADQTSASTFFNGDDAIVLKKSGTVLDVIGQVGTDPGTEWGSGNVSTQNNTLRRKPSINSGDTNETDAFDPSTEWYGLATDTFDGLGVYRGNITAPSDTTAPSVTTFTPADDATSIAVGANLEIQFDEDIVKGTNGDIVIKQAFNDQVFETINVTSAQVEINANTVTIDPSSNLDPLTEYYVEISSGAFQDTSENDYQGISDTNTWNFTTAGETIAIRRGNQILIDDDSDGTTDRTLIYGSGAEEDQYLVGDWDGDGTDEIAVRRGNAIHFDNDSDGTIDDTLLYGTGAGEDQYLSGDWDGDGIDEIALRRGNVMFLDDDSDGTTDRYLPYGTGAGEDQYLSGDWDGDGIDEIALRRGNVMFLDDDSDGTTDRYLPYGTGAGEDQYLSGDWDGDGIDEIALRRDDKFLMNYDTDGTPDRYLVYGLGNAEDEYLIGVFSDTVV
ncbi:MAG: hypothetical protein F6K18_02835 [Okeania sp. SIO2C2]|uniref:choice-of-anchor Y domain-containing protein n=1 Tax=Okeania sp. SIO2C2 TaxID=2607787 RepID=UPI0013B687BE|nr:Ig-like domain-containing protein [Okeania sp. SIO2C2]NEP85841.1 hypothetical protein [Okeania sp. SIO2C2]